MKMLWTSCAKGDFKHCYQGMPRVIRACSHKIIVI